MGCCRGVQRRLFLVVREEGLAIGVLDRDSPVGLMPIAQTAICAATAMTAPHDAHGILDGCPEPVTPRSARTWPVWARILTCAPSAAQLRATKQAQHRCKSVPRTERVLAAASCRDRLRYSRRPRCFRLRLDHLAIGSTLLELPLKLVFRGALRPVLSL